MVEQYRPQVTILRMRISCWIPKATNAYSEYAIPIAFPQQQRLHERSTVLRYTCEHVVALAEASYRLRHHHCHHLLATAAFFRLHDNKQNS
jgi:hypothetical protein